MKSKKKITITKEDRELKRGVDFTLNQKTGIIRFKQPFGETPKLIPTN